MASKGPPPRGQARVFRYNYHLWDDLRSVKTQSVFYDDLATTVRSCRMGARIAVGKRPQVHS